MSKQITRFDPTKKNIMFAVQQIEKYGDTAEIREQNEPSGRKVYSVFRTEETNG